MLTQSVTLNHKIRQSGLLEIDHIFICLSALPAASWLQEVGFVCAESKLFQVDRGTLSQVIFFETMYLELIEVVDCQAAERFAIETGINFIDRCHWQWSGASPFGLALRPKLEENSSVRSRRVPNLFASQSIDELSLSFSSENLLTPADPLCFVVPSAVALPALIDCHSEQYRQKVSHPLGLERLTHTRIQGQKSILRSQPIQFLQEAGMLTIALGQSPLLELTFDHHQQNKVLDFQRFDLPLVLKF